jgi:hypothetical protein
MACRLTVYRSVKVDSEPAGLGLNALNSSADTAKSMVKYRSIVDAQIRNVDGSTLTEV